MCRVSTQYRRRSFYLGGVLSWVLSWFPTASACDFLRIWPCFCFRTFLLAFRLSVTKLLSIFLLLPSAIHSIDPILVIMLFCQWLFDISRFQGISTSWLLNSLSIKLDCMFLSCHVRASEWIHTLYSCMNVMELIVCNRRQIWSLSNCKGTLTHNHLVRKQTLNHLATLAKWLSCVVITYQYGGIDCMILSCRVRFSEWNHTL